MLIDSSQGVGRGGQFILAIISWRVFAKYITTCMESEPVTYQLFRTVFLENEASLLSTYRTAKSFVWHRKLRSKAAMIFIVAAMMFILAFPTIISAMSGYDSNIASYLPSLDGNLIPFNQFSRVLYVIHDGWRINRTSDYWVYDVEAPYGQCPCKTKCTLVILTTKYPSRRTNIELYQRLRRISRHQYIFVCQGEFCVCL